MTQRRKQKRRIRDRMARSGERYSTARAVLLRRSRTTVAGSPVVMVPVRDMSRAVAFYRDALGFSLLGRSADDVWAELGNDMVRLGLHLGAQVGGDTGLGLLVVNLPDTCRAVSNHGGQIETGNGAGDGVVTIYDPDGNSLRLLNVTSSRTPTQT